MTTDSIEPSTSTVAVSRAEAPAPRKQRFAFLARPDTGMVESQGLGNLVPHLILWVGIAIVAFPVYLAFVGSTHEPSVIANGQMPLIPGTRLLENYYRTIFIGAGSSTREPVGTMLFNSFVMAMTIALGKIAISIISAYAIVYFRFPFRVSAFWIIFITLM